MRLINADMIEPHEQLEPLGNGEYEFALVVYMDDINALPSVDAAPVRLGKWILQGDRRKTLYGWYFCSECGAFIGGKTNFCSECGADMRGERP